MHTIHTARNHMSLFHTPKTTILQVHPTTATMLRVHPTDVRVNDVLAASGGGSLGLRETRILMLFV